MASASTTRRPADVVREQLSHYLGPFTSKNAVQMMSKQLGIDPDRLTAAQVPDLLDKLGPTLRTLLGKAGAEKVSAQIIEELSR